MNRLLDRICELLRHFEGCRLKAYQDVAGVWTIGYGETLGVVEGMIWTKERAETQLRGRAFYFLLNVYDKCPQLRNEPIDRVAACVSLTYNIGIAGFGISSVCRKTKRRDYKGAAASFALWNKAGGKVNKDLVWRRGKESEIYLNA